MPVYFVYRCHYGAPNEKHLLRFEYDTVLDWARAVWRAFPDYDEASRYAHELLGGLNVYSFADLFYLEPGQESDGRPETMEAVDRWFEAMYDSTRACGPHHVQVKTDDDELDMAVLVCDDHYRAANPGKADFLLLPTWELPGGALDAPAPDLSHIRTEPAEPRGNGEGVLYVFHEQPRSDNLGDKNDGDSAWRVAGVRVPDLAFHLLNSPERGDDNSTLVAIQVFLRALLENPTGEDAGFLMAIRDAPAERTTWAAYSDWLQEHDLPPAGLHLLERALREGNFSYQGANRNPAFDRVKVTPHMAQACKHEHRWHQAPMTDEINRHDVFEQIILFDDRWAAAQPTLAAGVLTFAARWDVLS